LIDFVAGVEEKIDLQHLKKSKITKAPEYHSNANTSL